jgi:glycosyltransferase involved in cell wall biosynthesis
MAMARVAMLVSNGHAPDPRVEKEAEALSAAGHAVTIYAFDRFRSAGPPVEHAGRVRIERVRPAVTLPLNMAATRIGLVHFHAAVRRRLLQAPADVVHCHDHDTCPVGAWWKRRGARRAGLAQGRFVFDAHDLYWTWALLPDPDARWRKAVAATLRWTDRRFARCADLLITTTQGGAGRRPGLAELYREWGCDPVVIWNAPPPGAVCPLPRRFTVGYIGNVRDPAMFDDLVDAIALLPAAERPALRIAGMGRSAAYVRRRLDEAGRRLGIEVTVSGAFHSREIPALMAAVSVQYCLYPMRRGHIDRAMPVKLLESVAHGRRVIGNADSLMGEWIRRHDWGWAIADGDPRALARAIGAAALACAADGDRPPVLDAPLLWPEQARRLADAYAMMLEPAPAALPREAGDRVWGAASVGHPAP